MRCLFQTCSVHVSDSYYKITGMPTSEWENWELLRVSRCIFQLIQNLNKRKVKKIPKTIISYFSKSQIKVLFSKVRKRLCTITVWLLEKIIKSKPNVTEIRWGFKKKSWFWKGVFKLNQFKQNPNQPVLKRCVCRRLHLFTSIHKPLFISCIHLSTQSLQK